MAPEKTTTGKKATRKSPSRNLGEIKQRKAHPDGGPRPASQGTFLAFQTANISHNGNDNSLGVPKYSPWWACGPQPAPGC